MLRLVEQDGRLEKVGMGAGAVDPRVGRRSDAQHVGPEVMDAHRALFARQAHHVGGLAHIGGIAQVAFRQRHLDVAVLLGGAADLGERGLAGLGG